MHKYLNVLGLVAILSLVMGCASDKFEPPPTGQGKVKAKEKSNIKKIQSTVPYGKKVQCSDIFDAATIGPYVNKEEGVTIKEAGHLSADANAVCKIMRTGEPPPLDEKKPVVINQILGVQPGEEYCSVEFHCSVSTDPKGFEEKCTIDKGTANRDLGQFSCVQTFMRGSHDAYTYKTIHHGANCIIKVLGGPSVVDEMLVQNCTKATLETVGKENFKNYK
jgi:hypothetical protein